MTAAAGSSTCLPEDHAGITNAIVQRPLLLVKERHDITDHAHQPAQKFGKIAPKRATIRDRSTFAGHDADFAGEFAEGRAVFADHDGFVSDADTHLDSHEQERHSKVR